MSRVPLLFSLILACTGGGAARDAADGDADGGDDAGDDDPGSGDTGSTVPSDEAVLRAAIAGESDPAEALLAVSRGNGLPVQTDAGFLFACLCGPGSWALAGDHEGWSGAPMAEAEGGLWWIEVDIPAADGSRYKFTDGAAWIADPLGRRYAHDEFGPISLVRASEAHLERHYAVEGGGLGPRDVRVWVPLGGAFSHLLLAHDGQNLFDPGALHGGWRLDQSLPESMLVVAIDNTPGRMDEYTHVPDTVFGEQMGGLADDYAVLVHEIVLPDAIARYGEPEVLGTMGSSLGGLVSLHLADRDPAAWDMAISLSGTLGWGSIGGDAETMVERYAAAGHRSTALFLDSGGSGPTCADSDGDGVPDDDPDARDNYCENAWMRDVLLDQGYAMEQDLWHWHEPGATHDEAAWAERVWRPLEIFAGL
jgi:hypothetical protein